MSNPETAKPTVKAWDPERLLTTEALELLAKTTANDPVDPKTKALNAHKAATEVLQTLRKFDEEHPQEFGPGWYILALSFALAKVMGAAEEATYRAFLVGALEGDILPTKGD